MAGRRGFISGLLAGTAVVLNVCHSSVAVAQYLAEPPLPTPEPDPVVSSGLTGLTADQWTLTAEPSLTGDTAMVDVLALPDVTGYHAEAVQVRVNDGAAVTLRYGNRLNVTRHIRIPATGTAQVQARILWRDTTDRITELASDWSEVKAVAAATAAAPTVEIEVIQINATAPSGCMFKGKATGFGVLNPVHDLVWRWDYGDIGSQHRRIGADRAKVFGTDANTSPDHLGAHTYEAPGDHTVTLTVTNAAGQSWSKTAVVTVGDPATAFERVAYIDPDMDATALPAGANPNFMFPRLSLASYQFSAKDTVKFLFRRGKVHDTTNTNWYNRSRLHIGNYGIDTDVGDPVWPGRIVFSTTAPNPDWAVHGIEINGGYDPSNPEVGLMPQNCIEMNPQMLLHDCKLAGGNTVVSVMENRMGMISSCEVTDWGNFGVEAYYHYDFALVGNTIAQNPMTLRGSVQSGDGKAIMHTTTNQWLADHGPFRSNEMRGDFICIDNDMFSCNSWASDNTIQTCLRVASVGNSCYDLVITRNMFEGALLNLSATAGNAGAGYINGKVARNVQILAGAAGYAYITFGGLLVENNVFTCSANHNENSPSSVFRAKEEDDGDYSNPKYYFSRKRANKDHRGDFPTVFRYNTVLNLRGTGGLVETSLEDGVPVVFENNVLHGPGVTGMVDVPNLDLSQKFSGRYMGRRVIFENGDAMQPEYANVDVGIIPVPQTACPVIGTATGNVPLDDFTGALRGDILGGLSRSRATPGAFEPVLES